LRNEPGYAHFIVTVRMEQLNSLATASCDILGVFDTAQNEEENVRN